MKIVIEIDTENAAFDEDNEGARQEGSMFETARILREVANRFAAGSWPMDGAIFDANGNTIGEVTLRD